VSDEASASLLVQDAYTYQHLHRHGPNKEDWPKADILRNLHKYIILDGCDEAGLSFVPNEGAGGELSTTLLEVSAC